MSATAKEYVYIVNVKKDTKPIRAISKERVTKAKATMAKIKKI